MSQLSCGRLQRPLPFASVPLAVLLGPTAPRAAEPYPIHVIATITGPSAFVGQYMKLNFDTFADWINQTGGIGGTPLKK